MRNAVWGCIAAGCISAQQLPQVFLEAWKALRICHQQPARDNF